MPDEAGTCYSRPLTAWNQAALRGYIRQVHCFPTDGGLDALETLSHELGEALRLVCLRTPYMAGTLSLSKTQPGIIVLHTHRSDQVARTICDARGDEHLGYTKLRDQGFPAGAFVGPLFNNQMALIEDGEPIPVTQFLLILVDDGILMCVYVFHAVTDGGGVNHFLSAVAAAMKDAKVFREAPLGYPARIDIPVPSNHHGGTEPAAKDAAKTLSRNCPEFDLVGAATNHKNHLASMYGLSRVKFGGIFVFGPERVRWLKAAVLSAGASSVPSTFTSLAALCWAFMTTTRLQTVGAADRYKRDNVECRIYIPTWWGDRLFRHELRGYAGNAVAFVEARHGAADLFAIAKEACGVPDDLAAASRNALLRVVRNIETALGSVDEDFVKTRSALFNCVPDPRLTQYNFDPADPGQLFFNSWRRLGADIAWTVPTASGPRLMAADAVRKTQDEWNESAGLIMPGRRDQRDYEVVLSSDADSMASLRNNPVWLSWVDKAIF